jgi:hypothetical protein
MTAGGEISLVLGVFELNLFFRQPVSINRTNQLLIFLQQPLSVFLSSLFVHLFLSILKTLMVSTGKWEYMHRDRHVNHVSLTIHFPEQVHPVTSLEGLRTTVIKLSTRSASPKNLVEWPR